MTDPTAPAPSVRALIRSTLIAIAAAATLLVTAVLPAEYGIDPTGVGRVLGLTQMGEIKMRLAREAADDAAADAKAVTPAAAAGAPAAGNSADTTRVPR